MIAGLKLPRALPLTADSRQDMPANAKLIDLVAGKLATCWAEHRIQEEAQSLVVEEHQEMGKLVAVAEMG